MISSMINPPEELMLELDLFLCEQHVVGFVLQQGGGRGGGAHPAAQMLSNEPGPLW